MIKRIGKVKWGGLEEPETILRQVPYV